jgi:hypothetical protein
MNIRPLSNAAHAKIKKIMPAVRRNSQMIEARTSQISHITGGPGCYVGFHCRPANEPLSKPSLAI